MSDPINLELFTHSSAPQYQPSITEDLVETLILCDPVDRSYARLFELMGKTAPQRRQFHHLIDAGIFQHVNPPDDPRQTKPVDLNPEAIPELLEKIDRRIERLKAVRYQLLAGHVKTEYVPEPKTSDSKYRREKRAKRRQRQTEVKDAPIAALWGRLRGETNGDVSPSV